jgi:hypothetical protein
MDKYLVDSAGWTRIGTGDGTSLTNWNTTSVLSYPSVGTMTDDAWGVWENADGAQLCLKVESSTAFEAAVSPGGGFVSTSTTFAVSPAETGTAPADMIDWQCGNMAGSDDGKVSMAYSADGNSVMVFGRSGSGTIYDERAFIMVKLEDVKAADVYPTYFPYWLFCYGASAANVWEAAYLSGGSGVRGWGYHPIQGAQEYYVMEPAIDGNDIFETLPLDPISGNSQRLELICGSGDAAGRHIRGRVPGLFRISPAVHGSGDRLDDAGAGVYDWIVIGAYAVPWFSDESMTW